MSILKNSTGNSSLAKDLVAHHEVLSYLPCSLKLERSQEVSEVIILLVGLDVRVANAAGWDVFVCCWSHRGGTLKVGKTGWSVWSIKRLWYILQKWS